MPDPNELAKLYWDQGLSQRQIAEKYHISRSTVAMALTRWQKRQEPRI